ncbi:MAG: type II toxin-antitoxin system VapC family toxin [Terriglobales bacterium]
MRSFLDTSALVKLYVREPGSEAMLQLADAAAAGELLISSLAGVEVASALCLLERTQKVSAEARRLLLGQFREDEGWRFTRQSVTDAVLGIASGLVERHPLRAYDAVQLASCLIGGSSGAQRFICSDRQLLAAALAENLDAWNPDSGVPIA